MGCVTSKSRAASFPDPSCKECLGGSQLNHWEFKNQFKATSCDECHRQINPGETVYGCRRCNYDECEECFTLYSGPSFSDISLGSDPAQQVSFEEVPSKHVSLEELPDALQDTLPVQQISVEEVPSERVSLEELPDALQDTLPVQQLLREEVPSERVSLEELPDALQDTLPVQQVSVEESLEEVRDVPLGDDKVRPVSIEITIGDSLSKLMVKSAEEFHKSSFEKMKLSEDSDLKLKGEVHDDFGLMLSSLAEEEAALVSIDKMDDDVVARNLSAEAIAQSLKEDTPHDFEGFTFGVATWCSECKKFLWGVQEQGDRCKVCAEARCHSCVQSGGRCQGTTTESSTFWCGPCCRPCCSAPVPESHRPRSNVCRV